MKKLVIIALLSFISVVAGFSQDKTVLLAEKGSELKYSAGIGYYIKNNDTTLFLGQTDDDALFKVRNMYCEVVDTKVERGVPRPDIIQIMGYFEMERVKKIIASIKERQ